MSSDPPLPTPNPPTSETAIDFRVHPEFYRIGRGEQGIFHVEPYKSELLPLWTIRTLEAATKSAVALRDRFLAYKAAGDFVGMDMTRKFLQMGYTRSRRYANYKGGRKRSRDGIPVEFGSGDPVKAKIAEMFRQTWREVADDPDYQQLKQQHQRLYESQS